MAIGKEICKKFPEIFVVMGGPSIRIDSEGIKAFLKQRPFLDLYILFEGEQPFNDFVHKFIQNNGITIDPDFKKIKGCAWFSSQGELIYASHKPWKTYQFYPHLI